jgi:hypothetical protein
MHLDHFAYIPFEQIGKSFKRVHGSNGDSRNDEAVGMRRG